MRSVKEWVGASDDTKVPPRVRDRVFIAKGGRCHKCKRKVNAAVERWTCEHLKSLGNGGENRESNLDVTCDNCLPAKNAEDAAEKKAVDRKRKKHTGITRPAGNIKSPGFPPAGKQNRAATPSKLAALPRPSLYGPAQ